MNVEGRGQLTLVTSLLPHELSEPSPWPLFLAFGASGFYQERVGGYFSTSSSGISSFSLAIDNPRILHLLHVRGK